MALIAVLITLHSSKGVDVHAIPTIELQKLVMEDFRKVSSEIDDDVRIHIPMSKVLVDDKIKGETGMKK